jgi:hypothetical protein
MSTHIKFSKIQAASVQVDSASKNGAANGELNEHSPASVLDNANQRSSLEMYCPPNALDGHTLPFPFENPLKRSTSATATIASRTISSMNFSGGTCVDGTRIQGNKEQEDIEKAERKKKKEWRQRSKHYFGNDTRNLFSPTVEFIAVRYKSRCQIKKLTKFR